MPCVPPPLQIDDVIDEIISLESSYEDVLSFGPGEGPLPLPSTVREGAGPREATPPMGQCGGVAWPYKARGVVFLCKRGSSSCPAWCAGPLREGEGPWQTPPTELGQCGGVACPYKERGVAYRHIRVRLLPLPYMVYCPFKRGGVALANPTHQTGAIGRCGFPI